MDSLLDPHVLLAPVRDDDGHIVDFVYTYVNDAALEDHNRTREALIGARFGTILPSEWDSGIFREYARVLETGKPYVGNGVPLTDDTNGGRQRRYDLRGILVGEELMLSWRDVTDRERTIEALAESEARFRLLAENATDLVFHIDDQGKILWVSPSVTSLMGLEPAELVGRTGMRLCEPEDHSTLISAVEQMLAGETAVCRVRLLHADGERRWVEITFRGISGADAAHPGGVAAVRDIHAEVVAERALEHAVVFDSLTGLARRSLALERIQAKLDEAQASGEAWSLLCAGVDGLSRINSAYTYAAGDEVIKEIASRLVEAAGSEDRVARIAGDEFAILIPELQSPAEAAVAANEILSAARGAVDIGEAKVDVTVSVGIATGVGGDAQILLRDATAAMRQAGRRSSDTWKFLDGNAGAEAQRVLKMQHDLRQDIALGLIQPWFMPIVDLQTNNVMGYEALARWVRAEGGVVLPAGFLSVAEGSDLILDLDAAILRQACEALAVLPEDQHVAVNLSPLTLALSNVPDLVRSAVQETGIDPQRLHLEITETSVVAVTDAVITAMREVSAMGISWWIDDFGTGFSSLSHLRDLPIDGIKLDRAFAGVVSDDAEEASRLRRLAQGIFGLATGLELRTVAEGVEHAEQAEVLTQQGWQCGQGWLFGKARPITELLPSLS